jgi:hypothetical protein
MREAGREAIMAEQKAGITQAYWISLRSYKKIL